MCRLSCTSALNVRQPGGWGFAIDSRAVVLRFYSLRNGNRELVGEILSPAHLLASRVCHLRVHWVPSHVCLQENDEADRLPSGAPSLITSTVIGQHASPQFLLGHEHSTMYPRLLVGLCPVSPVGRTLPTRSSTDQDTL